MQQINVVTLFKLVGVGLCQYLLYKIDKTKQQTKNKVSSLDKQPVLTPRQVSKNKPQQLFFLKVKFQKKFFQSNQYSMKRPLHSNEKYIYQPMLTNIISGAIQGISFRIKQDGTTWRGIGVDSSGSDIVGMGAIIDDILQVKRKVTENEIGIIKKIHQFIAYWLQRLLLLIKQKKNDEKDKNASQEFIPKSLLFEGPVIGTVQYLMEISNKGYLTLLCKLENGKIVAQFTARSKKSIIDALLSNADIESHFFRNYCLVLSVMVPLLNSLFKDLKRIYKAIKFHLKNNKKFLEIDDPEPEKSCIICYANTRNVVIYNCRHMIMCVRCYESMEYEACPICKAPVDHAGYINACQPNIE